MQAVGVGRLRFVSNYRNGSVCYAKQQSVTQDVGPATKVKQTIAAVLAAATIASPMICAAPSFAYLPKKDSISDPSQLLRNALPINNKPIRQAQASIELVTKALKVKGSDAPNASSRDFKKALDIVNNEQKTIIASFTAANKEKGLAALETLKSQLQEAVSGSAVTNDKEEIIQYERNTLQSVALVEQAMVDWPAFKVPQEYSKMAQLKGWATVEMIVDCVNREGDGESKTLTFKMVLDGYNAPITAGNVADLINRGFYNGMKIQRSDGFVVQTGDPDGPADGFIPPGDDKPRTIPLEYRLTGDKEITYDDNIDEIGRANDTPVLPFNAYGTLAMARDEFVNNSASSQIFWLLKDSELTPTGSNLLDGRFAVAGYITENENSIKEFKVGDIIRSMKIIEGGNLLKK